MILTARKEAKRIDITKGVAEIIGGFRGGAKGTAAPGFFLVFKNVFETLTLIYVASQIRSQCCMLKSEVFIWGEVGGEGGGRAPSL